MYSDVIEEIIVLIVANNEVLIKENASEVLY